MNASLEATQSPTHEEEHMSITSSGWILADCSLGHVGGRPTLGGHAIQFTIKFDTKPWTRNSPAPVVSLEQARLAMTKPSSVLVGFAIPDSVCAINISQYANTAHVTFSILLNRAAMHEIESVRNGAGVEMMLSLIGTIDDGEQRQHTQDSISVPLNQSDWLRLLNECGYAKSLMFEVPVFTEAELDTSSVTSSLRSAQQHLSLGHYQEVVAACRQAIEALNGALGQDTALNAARSAKGDAKRSLSITERELLVRGAVADFCHLAHHANEAQGRPFDRFDATMILAITASLAGSALARHQLQSLS